MSDPADLNVNPPTSTPVTHSSAERVDPVEGSSTGHAPQPAIQSTVAAAEENKLPSKALLTRRPPQREDGWERENEAHPKDPTDSLSDRPRDYEQYFSIRQEAAQYATHLRDHGFLVIGCHHGKCAEAASLTVIGNPVLGEVEQRYVPNSNHPLNDVLDRSLRRHIGKCGGRNVALLYHCSDQAGLAQIKLALQSRGFVGLTTEEHFWVVIQLTGEAWQAADDAKGFGTTPVWKVDARPHLLARFGVPPNQIDAKLDAIEQACGRGVLPADEEKLANRLQQLLETKTLDALLVTQGAAPDLPPSAEALAAELLGKANGVEKMALFLVANFPELHIGEFETLAQVLLAELPPPEPAADQKTPRPAVDYWRDEQEAVCRRLRLAHVPSLDGSPVVRFTVPGLDHAVQQALFPPYQLVLLERLHAAGLLLNPQTSPRIVDGLIEVTACFAPRYPDVYHRGWLMDRLRDAWRLRAEFDLGASQFAQNVSHTENDRRGLLGELRQHNRARHSLLVGRLVSMCRAFLGNERTAAIATAFLKDLIQSTRPNYDDAILIIGRLRGTGRFDANEWLGDLLGSARLDLRKRIVGLLLTQMRKPDRSPDPVAAWRTLAQIASWLPTKSEDLGEKDRWVLAFFYHVWENYQEWSASHGGREQDLPIPWLQPSDKLPSLSERLTLLTDWLAHPAFCGSLQHVLRQTLAEEYGEYWFRLERHLSPQFEASEFFLADALAGFYKQSGEPALLDLARRLSTRLPQALLDKLRLLIRLSSESGDELRRASNSEYRVLKRRLQRSYEFAGYLGGPKLKPSTP